MITVIMLGILGLNGNRMSQYDLSQLDNIFIDIEKHIKDKNISVAPAIVRADQDFIKKAINSGDINYPFVTFKAITTPIEDRWNHVIEDKSGGLENDDKNKPNNLNIRSMQVRPMVSISIVSETADGLDKCNKIAQEILEYFYTTDLKEAVAFIDGKVIEDRTTAFDGEIEYKLGFDIEIQFNATIEKISEAIKTIIIDSTTDTGNGKIDSSTKITKQ